MNRVAWFCLALLLVMGAIATMFAANLGARGTRRSAHPLQSRMAPAVEGIEEDVDGRAEMEFQMLRDPRANAIPDGIRKRELAFARTLPRRVTPGRGLTTTAAGNITWTERGPNNVGGRTRAFAIDAARPT